MMSENLRVSACDDALGVVDAERGLRHVGDRRIGREIELVDVLLVLHQHDRRRDLAHRAFDFRMAGMADQDQLAALADIALALVVHLGDQRAGGVEHRQAARAGLLLDALGDAVRGEHRHGVRRHFGQLLDEHRALGLEILDDVLVVHDLVAHIDRRAVLLQRALDDLDRTHHAGAEAAGLGQDDLHRRTRSLRGSRPQIELCARKPRATFGA